MLVSIPINSVISMQFGKLIVLICDNCDRLCIVMLNKSIINCPSSLGAARFLSNSMAREEGFFYFKGGQYDLQ